MSEEEVKKPSASEIEEKLKEQPKEATKSELELQVEREMLEKARAEDLDVITRRKRKEVQHEKNKILVQKAVDSGFTDAPTIGKHIRMSANGVRRYADELGIKLKMTQAERKRLAKKYRDEEEEEVERIKLGLSEG